MADTVTLVFSSIALSFHYLEIMKCVLALLLCTACLVMADQSVEKLVWKEVHNIKLKPENYTMIECVDMCDRIFHLILAHDEGLTDIYCVDQCRCQYRKSFEECTVEAK